MEKILLAFLLLFSTTAFGQKAKKADPYFFLSRWAVGKKLVNESNGEKSTTQYRQRFVMMGDEQVPVATMTSTEIQLRDDKSPVPDVAKRVADLTGIKKWKFEDRGSYKAYEAELVEHTRYLKLFVSKQGKVLKYSLVTIRIPYMMPTYFEAELLQRDEIGAERNTANFAQPGSMFAQVYQLLVPTAHAFTYADVLSVIRDVWAPGVNSVNGLSSEVGKINGTVANGVNSFTSGVNTFNGTANRAIDQAGNINGTLNSLNSTARDINATARDKGNALKMGAALGVGAAVGTLGVNLVTHFITDVGAPLARKAYYELIGELTPEVQKAISERAPEAWKNLEFYTDKAAEIEKKMALQLGAMEWLARFNPTTSAEEIDKQLIIKQSELKKAEARLDHASSSSSQNICAGEVRQLQKEIAYLKAIMPVIKEGGPESAIRAQDLCSTFDRMYGEWANVEMQLNNARSAFIRNAYIITKDAEAAGREAARDLAGSDRKKGNKCEDSPELKDAQNAISKKDCKCGTPDEARENCAELCQTRTDYEAHIRSCLNMANLGGKVDESGDRARRASLLRQNSEMLENTYKNFLGTYCDSKKQDCEGNKDGSFKALTDRMQTRFSAIFKMCGSKTVVRTMKPANVDINDTAGLEAAKKDVPISTLPKAAQPNASSQGWWQKFLGFFKFW